MLQIRQCTRVKQFLWCPAFTVLLLPIVAVSQDGHEKVLKRFQSEIVAGTAAMDSVKDELERGRRRLKELEKKEESTLLQLEQLEKNLAVAQGLVKRMSSAVDSMNRSIMELHDQLAVEQQRLSDRQERMASRLRSMYKTGDINFFQVLFSSATVVDLLYRVRYFQRLKAYDAEMIADIMRTRETIALRSAEIEIARDEQVRLIDKRRAEQVALSRDRENQRSLVESIKGEKEAYLASVRELESSQKQLKVIIDQLQKRAAKAKSEYERSLTVKFEGRKGKLPWPVLGEVIKPFGKIVHPVYKTVTVNNGIDIRAAQGSPVVCVAPGKVAYVGHMRGLGRFMVVDHFGGYLTVYANLASVNVAVETDVEYGTVLGTVDLDPGGTLARLHFEVRKSSKSLDPSHWLESL